jgi:integrase
MVENYTKRLNGAKNLIKKSKIQSENKKYILAFIDQLSAEGISKVRQLKYLYTLKTLTNLMETDFLKADKQDIIQLMNKINNSEYKEWTKRDFKVVIKRFYRWIREKEGKKYSRGEYPKEVKWINTGKKNHNKKLPNQLFTIEDIKILANNAKNLRDRCLIFLLYETGARIGEIMNIQIKDIEFDKYGALITLFGKTGARKIRVIASSPAISSWLMEHPARENQDSLLLCGIWSKKRGDDISYNTINKMLREAKKTAGIKKPVNPHHFRHSRATELAKKLTESQLCTYMGWVQGSQEAATYVHLSGRDMDKAILALHGLAEEEQEKDKFKIIECPRCNIKNDPSAKYCKGCSLGLDEKTVMEYDQHKELAAKLGFDIKGILNDHDFMVSMMNTMAKEWEKRQEK